MNEEKKGLRTRIATLETINEERMKEVSETTEIQKIGFYLSFISSKFIPCPECQRELMQLIRDAEEVHIGNDTKPEVEFFVYWEIDDYSWKVARKEKPTQEELARWEKKGFL